MTVIRLHPNRPEGWALWPVFEARAKDFMQRVGGDVPNEQMIAWLRDTFVNRSEILGAWMALEGERPVGHLLAWADAFFGEPFVFVHQVETEPGATVGALHEHMVAALRTWIDEMNAAYERVQPPTTLRIRRLRFSTERSSPAWQRYLAPLGTIEKERVVLTFNVAASAPARKATVAPVLVPPPFAVVNGQEHA